jgi:DNA-binding MarR family transcriptional regulator
VPADRQAQQARGLVVRGAHPQDGRGVLVTLTAAGRELVDRVLPDHLATEQRLLAGLPATERARLARLLRAMEAAEG